MNHKGKDVNPDLPADQWDKRSVLGHAQINKGRMKGDDHEMNSAQTAKRFERRLALHEKIQKRLHFISFHFISFHFTSFHFISFHLISFHFISFHFHFLFIKKGGLSPLWLIFKGPSIDLCLFVPCFPAFFDLLISLGL